jgi:lactoylglutathione lyase
MSAAPAIATIADAPFQEAAIAHAMIRVRDLEASIGFYTRVLGMTLMRREDFFAGHVTLAFLGYPIPGVANPVTIELTHNWDQGEDCTHGSGFGHIALRVADVYAATAAAEAAGATVIRPAGPMKSGAEVIAFLTDPDGFRIELVAAR